MPAQRGSASVVGPRVSLATVRRPRLEALCEPLAPVTVVQGAPGYGKTTFLAHWAESLAGRGHLVLWLDAYLADTGDALRAVARALAEAEGLDPEGPAGWDMIRLSAYVRGLDQPVVAVVDHVDLAPDDLDTLARLLARCPDFHVVVTAFEHHPLAELAARAALDQRFVTAPELAFTDEEALELARLLGAVGGELAPVLEVNERLAGWPRLVVEVLRGSLPVWPQVDFSAVRAFVEWAERERPLSDEALGDVLTLALASPVTSEQWMRGQGGGGPVPGPFARLRRLEVVGIARRELPPDQDEALWVMAPELRRAIVAVLAERRPAETERAHRRLARAFVDQGLTPRGLRHALVAHDWATLEDLWVTHGFAPLTAPDAALDPLPEVPPLGRSGSIALRHAHAVVAATGRGDARAVRTAVIRAERELASLVTATGSTWRPSPAIAHVVAHLQQTAALDDSRPEHAAALATFDGDTATEPYFTHLARARGALARALAGDLPGATAALADARVRLGGPAEPDVGAVLDAFEALVHVRSGRLVASEAALARSRESGRDRRGVTILRGLQAVVGAQLALARLDLDTLDEELATGHRHAADEDAAWFLFLEARALRETLHGNPAKALALLADGAPGRTRSTLARRVLERSTVDALCALGEINRAQAILDRHDLGRLHPVAQARVHLLAGEHEAAETIASRVAWRRGSNLGQRTSLNVIRAAALADRDGDAVTAWRRALVLAAGEQNLLPYAFLPGKVRDRLLAEPELLPPGAGERLARVSLDVPEPVPLVHLTPRERVVLEHLVVHDTLPAVAAALTVSVNTVKKQTLRIYAKLGVNERGAALRRARELGLV